MPLLKLWNSICGNTAKPAPASSEPVAKTQTREKTRSKKSVQASEETPARKSRSRRNDQGETRILAKATKPTRNLLDMMSRGSHASICRLVKRSGATSILEIGVGDGKRALAVTQALADANPNTTVRYAAIDMFEMADGPITLKEFNQQLRSQGVQATLVPMEIQPGIARVSSTIGVVDLVLIGDNQSDVDMTTLISSLRRVSGKTTSVFQLVDEKWERVDADKQLNSRRAA